MADFCKQCASMMGFNKCDLNGLSTEADTQAGLFAFAVCEGCGFIQVDHEGNCISDNCLENHNTTKDA